MSSFIANKDGRIEVFAIGGNWSLYHSWQKTPGGGWSPWHGLGGKIKQIAVGKNLDGRIEVFAIAADGTPFHIWQTSPGGGWSDWSSLSGKAKQLVVGRNKDGRLEVFVIGTDDTVYHKWQNVPNGGWVAGWPSLGGKVKHIAVAANTDGRLELLAVNHQSILYRRSQTAPNAGPWANWESLQNGQLESTSIARGPNGELRAYSVSTALSEVVEQRQNQAGIWNSPSVISDGHKYHRAYAAETKGGLLLNLLGKDDRFYTRTLQSSGLWSPRKEFVLPATPDETALPPGGMAGLTSTASLANANNLLGGTAASDPDRVERLKFYRALCLGIAIGGFLKGDPITAAAGVACTIAAEAELRKESEQQGQPQQPTTASDPTPTQPQRDVGGVEKEPKVIHGVDSSPASRESVSVIA